MAGQEANKAARGSTAHDHAVAHAGAVVELEFSIVYLMTHLAVVAARPGAMPRHSDGGQVAASGVSALVVKGRWS
jgi:hypothetical protein